MSELVMVISDLYLPARDGAASATPRAPGLARLTRFGVARTLPEGWRAWLATRLGVPEFAAASPGAVAAAAVDPALGASASSAWVWLATPVHLIAGLRSVHLTAMLRLAPREQTALCEAFAEQFATAGYALTATRGGRFLATGPAPSDRIETTDPARALGASLDDGLARGRAAQDLRRLGAEIEMWLHEHPLNAERARSGALPVTTLWLWGGGPPLATPSLLTPSSHPACVLCGDDPFLEGLSRGLGLRAAPTPEGLAAMAPVRDVVAVVQLELGAAMASRPDARHAPPGLASGIGVLEADWIAPALERLDRGQIERLTVIAGDRQVVLTRHDGWKRWRRPRAPLAAFAVP